MTSQPVGADAPTTVSIAAGPLVGPILRRVVGMLAARADLPLDRLDDAVLVADLIAARRPRTCCTGPSTWPSNLARARSRCASARSAPAAATRSSSTPRCPGVGNVIEQLADELRVAPEGEREFLHVRLEYAGSAN